uniref:Piwi domain-containing protein n=1 Tax=Steinernema glaseri TaxID=37863 RepID=A0A1I8AIG6_9BILA
MNLVHRLPMIFVPKKEDTRAQANNSKGFKDLKAAMNEYPMANLTYFSYQKGHAPKTFEERRHAGPTSGSTVAMKRALRRDYPRGSVVT